VSTLVLLSVVGTLPAKIGRRRPDAANNADSTHRPDLRVAFFEQSASACFLTARIALCYKRRSTVIVNGTPSINPCSAIGAIVGPLTAQVAEENLS
jgi:hypothetical protein